MLNFQKHKARDRVKFSAELEEILADEAAADCQEDIIDTLESCLSKLSPGDRDLLGRRYAPGATNRSLARALGRSESAISRTLDKIYGRLLTCIHVTQRAELPRVEP